MTDEQILNNRRAWDIMCAQYSGIEKWQRQQVYENAITDGVTHAEALEAAHGCAVGDLPDIVFQADTIDEVGDLTIESGSFDPPLKMWDTRSFRYQKRED